MPDSAPQIPPRRPFGQRTYRVLFYAMLLGLALIFAAFAINEELVFIGLPLVLVCASALFIGPTVTLALPPFRSRPAAERVPLRFPAILSGIGVAAIGAFWARAAEGPAAFAAGLALVVAAAWTVAQAIALPRVAPAGGIAQVVAHTGMVLAAALFAALALGAVPKFEGTKERAYLAAMKSDLRNLVTAEEAYFADSLHYTTNLGTSFATTSNVTGPEIKLTATGWTAKVAHTTTIYTCAIFVGQTPLPPAAIEGTPACDNVHPPFASQMLLVIALVIAAGAGVALSRLTPPAP